MNLIHILNGLESCTATGDEASRMARLGFLEWAFCGGNTTPQAAHRALEHGAVAGASSDAARVFVGFLRQAALPRPLPVRKGRRRVLH